MALQDKYQELINFASGNGVTNLRVAEQNGVLYVTATVPSSQVKQKFWDIYQKIDPDMRAADLVLNISVEAGAVQTYEVQKGDSLSTIAKNYSGINWKDIYEANRDQIKDPDKIFPGQVLKIPV